MIPAERAHLHVAAQTHPGMSGKNNEDRFGVSALRLEGDRPRSVVFAVVSDGIGGHRAGEVAAEIAVETISRVVSRSDGSQPIETLRQAILQASQNIYAEAQADAGKHGMGATCACALIIENRLYMAYVGDSRIYLLRDGVIQQITIDHTWIQEALDAGVITPEQSANHPNAHVIRRYLGAPQPVEVDTRLRLASDESPEQMQANQGLQLRPGDQLLLCSDGLTDLVKPEEIQARLQSWPGAEQPQALKELTDLANERGGHDNITIIALQIPSGAAELAPTLPVTVRVQQQAAAPGRRRALAGCLTMSALAVIVLAALGTAYWLYVTRIAPGQVTPTLPTVAATPATSAPATTRPTAGTESATPARSSPTTSASATPRPATGSPTTGTPARPTLTPWPTNTP